MREALGFGKIRESGKEDRKRDIEIEGRERDDRMRGREK